MRKSRVYFIAFGLSLLVLFYFSLLHYGNIRSLNAYSAQVYRGQMIMHLLEKLHAKVIDAETGYRGYLLTLDSTFLDPLLAVRYEIPLVLDSLKNLTLNNPVQRTNIDSLNGVVWNRLHRLEEVLNREQLQQGKNLTESLKEGKTLMNEFRVLIHSIMDEEEILLMQHARKKAEVERLTPEYFNIILLLSFITSMISFVLLMWEFRERKAAQGLLEKRFHSLNRSNAELQQIAFVTSHDLQEPLRKILTFSDALLIKHQQTIPQEVKYMLNRIETNVFRMRELVADLSSFTSLSCQNGNTAVVNLNNLLQTIQDELAPEIAMKNAKIILENLPNVRGYSKQLKMLFKELLVNALKFSRPDVVPSISILNDQRSGGTDDSPDPDHLYHIISIRDNGIGFEKQYARKIFVLFQTLHNKEEFEGKGLGLSLCQRIMVNHDGFITAHGEPGRGAIFRLYFPSKIIQ